MKRFFVVSVITLLAFASFASAQQRQFTIDDLLRKIDASAGTPTEKENAKGIISTLLAHPLLVTLAGSLAGSAAGI